MTDTVMVTQQKNAQAVFHQATALGTLVARGNGTEHPPTRTTSFERYAQDLHLDVTVHKETVPTNTRFEIPITVTNNGEEADEVTVGLRARASLLSEATVTVPPGDVQQLTLTENLPQTIELEITRNGQKTGSVQLVDG